MEKRNYPLVVFAMLYLLFFTILAFFRRNYEFIIYIGVVIFFAIVIIKTLDKVLYTRLSLWGLAIWGFLHMCGGLILVNGTVLYAYMIIPITDQILKYDQVIHVFGFFVATLVMWDVMKTIIKNPEQHWVRIGIVVIMAGLGLGALNEIIEFTATVILPETGVGGYVNTGYDLVADLIGALIAFVVIKQKY